MSNTPNAPVEPVNPDRSAALNEITAHLDSLSDDEVRKTAIELKTLLADDKPADESESPPSLGDVDPNDREAVAARNAVLGRAMRLMVFDRSGRYAAGVCEAAEIEAADFDAAIERQTVRAEACQCGPKAEPVDA